MSFDSAGNIVPKTPETGLVAATAYLMANPPPVDDPRYGIYKAAITGIGVVGAALDKQANGQEAPPRREPATAQQGNPSHQRPASAREVITQKRINRSRDEREARGSSDSEDADETCDTPCFSSIIRHAKMPKEYRGAPRDITKYDGTEDPKQWLDDYRVSIKCAGGNRITAMQCLQLYLKGSARAWLKSLTPDSIGSWVELKAAFVRNFAATCTRPTSVEELRTCRQRSSESLRSFIGRWNNLKNATEGLSEERAIDAFKDGIRRRELKEELGRVKPKSISDLMDIANRWADGEDAVNPVRARTPEEDEAEASRRRDRRRKRKDRYDEHDNTEFVAAGFTGKREGEPRVTGDRNSGYRTSHYRGGGDRGADEYRRRDPNYRPRRDEGPSGMESGVRAMHYALLHRQRRQPQVQPSPEGLPEVPA